MTTETIIALGFLGFSAVVIIVALIRYPKVEEFIKFWAAVGSLICGLLGAIVAFYFTKEVKEKEAKVQIATIEKNLTEANQTVAQLQIEIAKNNREEVNSLMASLQDQLGKNGILQVVP